MFLGETLCLVAFNALLFWYRGKPEVIKKIDTAKPFNRFLLAIPAMCDMTGTSLMYVGLTLTYASMFQMLRGSVVIFTGVFSVLFLKRKLHLHHWTGMGLVLLGTVIVGLTPIITGKSGNSSADAPNPTVGNLIIVLCQIIVAAQMVVEEKLIGGFKIPALQVVGWEGSFGAIMLGILLIPMYFIPQPTIFNTTQVEASHFEDAIDAFKQIGSSWQLALFMFGNVISIAFFNFSGVSVTQHLSASTRMVLDSLRTIVIWAVSLALKWQEFDYPQVIGFVLLLGGSAIYNRIFEVPYLPYPEEEDSAPAKKPLLDADSDEEGGSLNALSAGDPSLASPSPMLSNHDAFMTPSMGKNTAVKLR
jgi:drug/metabolite transporter (DMT)-like permease